jgi:ATP-binding cassette subfamily F protein uup
MLLFRLNNLSLAFGDQPLLDQVNLTIHKGERIGILGQNGAGKSTFMKVLMGQIVADSGELWRAESIKVAYLDQSLPAQDEQTIYDYIANGLEGLGTVLARYHALTRDEDLDWGDEKNMHELASLQKQIEERDGWAFEHKIEGMLDILNLPADAQMKTLSGGSRRRAALGRALISDPDLLMLDEPTNHLDIPTIEWLEKAIREFRGAILVITHDRHFLQQISNRIIELDRGHVRSWDYGYESFLEFRDQQLEAEDKANAEFDKKLADEERWIRQGVKARRTRNEGRVRALEKMREERSQRRELTGKAKFGLEQGASSGKIVIEANNLTHGYDKPILKNFSTKILRGDRVGFIGANGSGKTTLLRILLGETQPDAGEVKLGTNLDILYFDQLRNKLDPEATVIDNLAEGREFIEINGKNRHVISYLQDFLFPPKRTRQPVKSLSGGEQNRLILAKLFSKPANLIVLDEPTNDLDMETLELLEELLLEFTGTLLVVSHDRKFLDNVITNCIVFEAPGVVKEYVGGYQDWLNQGGKMMSFEDAPSEAKAAAQKATEPAQTTPAAPATAAPTPAPVKKLSYKQQRELDQGTQQIEKTETAIADITRRMEDPGFYDQPATDVQSTLQQMAALQEALDGLFERWAELENNT